MKKDIYFVIITLLIFFISEALIYTFDGLRIQANTGFENLTDNLKSLETLYINDKFLFLIIFSFIFILLQIMFIPFTGSFTAIIFGFMFGWTNSAVLFSFLSTIGFTCAFIVSRKILKATGVKSNGKVKKIVDAFKENGLLYFFSLRFSGVIPASFVNFAMGATSISAKSFYLITQFATFHFVIIYTYIGSHLKLNKKVEDIFSFKFSLLIVIISLLPLIFKDIHMRIFKNKS